MKKNELFPSDYLKACDISGVGESYVMQTVKMEQFDDMETREKVMKPVLNFSNSKKRLILNVTNFERIAKLHGDDTDLWLGRSITLHLEEVSAFGKTSDCVRVATTKPE